MSEHAAFIKLFSQLGDSSVAPDFCSHILAHIHQARLQRARRRLLSGCALVFGGSVLTVIAVAYSMRGVVEW